MIKRQNKGTCGIKKLGSESVVCPFFLSQTRTEQKKRPLSFFFVKLTCREIKNFLVNSFAKFMMTAVTSVLCRSFNIQKAWDCVTVKHLMNFVNFMLKQVD